MLIAFFDCCKIESVLIFLRSEVSTSSAWIVFRVREGFSPSSDLHLGYFRELWTEGDVLLQTFAALVATMDLTSLRLQPVEFLVDQELAFKDPATLVPFKVQCALVDIRKSVGDCILVLCWSNDLGSSPHTTGPIRSGSLAFEVKGW